MMLSVGFVLLAALTLLPALLGPGIDKFALPWHSVGDHRSARFARVRRPGAQATRCVAAVGAIVLLLGSPPRCSSLETGMPSITMLPKDEQARQGYDFLAASFGPGGPGPIQVIVPAGADVEAVAAQVVTAVEGVAMAFPPQPGAAGASLIQAVGTYDPSSKEAIDLIASLRDELPASVLVGGPVAENHDLDHTLRDKAPLVMGVVLVLGFLLLVVALQALLVAVVGVIFNLLSVGAAFGVGALAFQHGWARRADGLREPGVPHLVGAAVLLHPRVRHLDGLHGVPARLDP